jgi:hypothetical protein
MCRRRPRRLRSVRWPRRGCCVQWPLRWAACNTGASTTAQLRPPSSPSSPLSFPSSLPSVPRSPLITSLSLLGTGGSNCTLCVFRACLGESFQEVQGRTLRVCPILGYAAFLYVPGLKRAATDYDTSPACHLMHLFDQTRTRVHHWRHA